jgi:hypothetical protein
MSGPLGLCNIAQHIDVSLWLQIIKFLKNETQLADERTITKLILMEAWKSVYWINLAKYEDKRRDFAITIMINEFHKERGIS